MCRINGTRDVDRGKSFTVVGDMCGFLPVWEVWRGAYRYTVARLTPSVVAMEAAPAVMHKTCKRSFLVCQRLRPTDGLPRARRASGAAERRSRPNANSMAAVAMAAATIAAPRNPTRCAHRPVKTVPTSLPSVRATRPVRVARSHHRGLPRSGSHL